MTVEIIINDVHDLLTVAAILIKNGYTVRKSRRRKQEGKNVYLQILIATREDGT